MEPLSAAYDFALQWKELIGAVLGGLFSLLVALIVARDARTREERTAATVLTTALTTVAAQYSALMETAKSQNVPEENLHLWVGEKLAYSSPVMTPAVELAITRLMVVDTLLAVHLEFYKTMQMELARHVQRIEQDYKELHEFGKSKRPGPAMDASNKVAAMSFEGMNRHAICAANRLNLVVLSRLALFHRVRMKLMPTTTEKECLKALSAK